MPPPGFVFLSTPGRLEKKNNYHFEMEKISLILIYNIFVTKHQKKFDSHVSCRPGQMTANKHAFKSGPKDKLCFPTWKESFLSVKMKSYKSAMETIIIKKDRSSFLNIIKNDSLVSISETVHHLSIIFGIIFS